MMLNKINPNYLTGLGLTLFPFIVITQQVGGVVGLSLCLFILSLREGIDLLDGRLARHTKQISDFGKLFDPYADSVCKVSLFIAFLVSDWIPLWMVLVIFFRDMTVWFIRAIAASYGIVIAARPSGKYLHALPQSIAQIAIILGYLLVECGVNLPIEEIAWVLLFVATATTVTTLFDYVIAAYDQITAKVKVL